MVQSDDFFVYDNETSCISILPANDTKSFVFDDSFNEDEPNDASVGETTLTPSDLNISALIDVKQSEELMQSILKKLSSDTDDKTADVTLTTTCVDEVESDSIINGSAEKGEMEVSKRFSILPDEILSFISVNEKSFVETDLPLNKRKLTDITNNIDIPESEVVESAKRARKSARFASGVVDNNLGSQSLDKGKPYHFEYDDATKEKMKDIRFRWGVNDLADPNVNLTCANYARRHHNISKVITEGVDIHNPLVEPTKKSRSRVNVEELEQGIKRRYDVWWKAILNMRKEETASLAYTGAPNYNGLAFVNREDLQKVNQRYEERTQHFIECRDVEIHALEKLKSCRAKDLECDENFVGLMLRQPVQQRLKYMDDGIRKLFLPRRIAEAIIVEDMIYEKLYGKYS